MTLSDIQTHISHVIITYALESLSSLTRIARNPQVTIIFKEKWLENKQQNEGTHQVHLSLETANLYQSTTWLSDAMISNTPGVGGTCYVDLTGGVPPASVPFFRPISVAKGLFLARFP